MYVVLLGLDVLGNPFGLAVGVARSVEDLFYEPFQVHSYTLMPHEGNINIHITYIYKEI